MNGDHQYSLEKGSKKHLCPSCNKKTFVRYIDTKTGNYLPEQYGRCDRESKCSYHLNPYVDGYAKAMSEKEQIVSGFTIQKQRHVSTHLKSLSQPEPVFFDFETFKQTLQLERYEKNRFIQNLMYRVPFPFDADEITEVVQLYRLGTIANGYRTGAITFPYIDINGNVRAVQVKQFDEHNHTTGTDFLHSIIEKHHTRNNKPMLGWLEAYTNQDKRISCLFGEHLLSKYPGNPIALVEAPKTAVYGTLYFGLPETPASLIWLAVYNKSSLSFEKLKVLQGRFVYVFPDLSKDGSTYNEWEAKTKEYESQLPGTMFIFSDLLERLAPEQDKSEGYDLADYLIKQDWKQYRQHRTKDQPIRVEVIKSEAREQSEAPKTNLSLQFNPSAIVEASTSMQINPQIKAQTEDWRNEIVELESFFSDIEIPTKLLKLSESILITDCHLFIESHIAVLWANNEKASSLPYLNRLRRFRDLISER